MGIKASFNFRVRVSRRNSGSAGESASAPATGHELQFQPAAERYRRRLGAFVAVLFLGICLAFVSLFVAEPFDKWVGVPGIACVFAALLLYFTAPALNCPACTKATDSALDQYCPACGHAPIRISRTLGTHCDACGRTMGSYKYRNYPIRYCTHCGTLVDKRGV